MYHKYSIISPEGLYVNSWCLLDGKLNVVLTKNILCSLGFSSKVVAKRHVRTINKYSDCEYKVV